jgi:hypothetical protein
MVVRMVSSLVVHMTIHMDMVFFTPVDMTMVDFVQDGGGMAEKIPVAGDDDLIKISAGRP